MASIRQRKTKSGVDRYDVLWRQDDRQTSATFNDLKSAQQWKDLVDEHGPEKAAALAGRERLEPRWRAITITDWCLTHIEKLTGVEDGTREKYRSYVRHDINGTIGAVPVPVLSHFQVADWVNAMDTSGKTISNKLSFLSSAMTTAVRAGLRADNPCTGVRAPRNQRSEAVFLSMEQLMAILDRMPSRWHALVLFLVGTGLRFSEATALQVGDIDAEAMTLRVTRAWKYTGNSSRVLGPPKSRRSTRTINVPGQVIDACGDLTRRSDAFVFVNSVGNPVQSQLLYNTGWTPAVRAVMADEAVPSLPHRPRIHDLRHTCASLMIKGGTPLPVIKQHLGHESITTTLDLYGHIDRGEMQKAARSLERAFESVCLRG